MCVSVPNACLPNMCVFLAGDDAPTLDAVLVAGMRELAGVPNV